MNPVTVAAIQMTSTTDVKQNLTNCAAYIKQASAAGAKLVALPEMFAAIGGGPKRFMAIAEVMHRGPIQDFLQQQAAQHNIWLIGGTIPIKPEISEKPIRHKPQPVQVQVQVQAKARAACLVYDNTGQLVTRYDKLHLFDADTEHESQRESQYTTHGEQIVTTNTPFGKLGLCVCFDLRFPELFRLFFQEHVRLVTVSSAFLHDTGKSHWEVLLRARAIENCCYIIAPNQYGWHTAHRRSYGDTMIVGPDGHILARKTEQPGIVLADIDVSKIPNMLAKFPIDKHQRIKINKNSIMANK